MFDIGWSELLLIGVVALIAIGPKELPGVLRAVGQWTAKIRRMASEFQGQFQEALREAEMADLKKQVDDLNDAARSFTKFDPLADQPNPPASSPVGTTPETPAALPPPEGVAALPPPEPASSDAPLPAAEQPPPPSISTEPVVGAAVAPAEVPAAPAAPVHGPAETPTTETPTIGTAPARTAGESAPAGDRPA